MCLFMPTIASSVSVRRRVGLLNSYLYSIRFEKFLKQVSQINDGGGGGGSDNRLILSATESLQME